MRCPRVARSAMNARYVNSGKNFQALADAVRVLGAQGGITTILPEDDMTELRTWVDDHTALLQPDRVVWIDGSRAQLDGLIHEMVEQGRLLQLNPEHRPYSFLARSDPDDVARVESRTFVCSLDEADAGPTNNWREPTAMRDELTGLFEGAMRGRTLYVVPFSMGPVGGKLSRLGVQLTDSAYVVVSMAIMTRVGDEIVR